MAEQIDRKLNLVLTYPRTGVAPLHIHATAISLQVFETYYLIIARAFATINTIAGGVAGGPRIANLELKRAATDLGMDPAPLLAEIKRLSSVARSTDKGWENLPLPEAIAKKMLDEDEVSEVENALAFFTVVSRMYRKSDLVGVLGMMTEIWGARIVSSNSTAFKDSLAIWTPTDSTGEKATA